MGMFDDIIGIGNLISDTWKGMSELDKMAIRTAPIPIVGDIVGGVADAKAFYDDPSWVNAGLFGAGLIPFVPSGSVTRTLRKALPQAPNDLPGFYSGNRGGQLFAAGRGAAQGARNLVEARYSPNARALQREGVSVADTRAARRAIKEFQDPELGT